MLCAEACLCESEGIHKAVAADERVLSPQISLESSHEAQAKPAG